MSRLDELRKDITTMSLEELREHVRQIRRDRRITKTRPAEKRARVRMSDKAKTSVKRALDKMSSADMEALLRELDNEGSGSTSG